MPRCCSSMPSLGPERYDIVKAEMTCSLGAPEATRDPASDNHSVEDSGRTARS